MDTKALQLSDKAAKLGYNMFYDKTGYEFREQVGNKKFSVKNIDQGHIMLDMIARVPSAETVAKSNYWLHLSKDTTASSSELNAIARDVMEKISGSIEPDLSPKSTGTFKM